MLPGVRSQSRHSPVSVGVGLRRLGCVDVVGGERARVLGAVGSGFAC